MARKHLGIARSGGKQKTEMGVLLKWNQYIHTWPRISLSHPVGLRSSLNNIRKDLHLLRDEVGFLSDSVNDLQAEADV